MRSCTLCSRRSRARAPLRAGVVLATLVTACGPDLTSPDPAPPAVSLLETSGTWTTKAPMPTPRSHLKAATVNGVIYAIGGFGYAPAAGGYLIRSKVEAYDVASNSWTVKKALPEPLEPNGATNINGKIYVAGGLSNERYSKALYVYDPGTNVWTRKADMPFTVAGYSAGHQETINGKLYVYAGVTVNADGSEGPHRFFRYNPATNTWTTLSRPSYARRGGASGVVNGRLYLVGGTLPTSPSGQGYAYDVHVYDPATGWTKVPLGVTGISRRLAYATLGGKIYLVGSSYYDGCEYRSAGIYNPATNTLGSFASLFASSRANAAGAAAKGQFFVIGGENYEPDASGCGLGGEVTGNVKAYTP
jgi:N-acetylneuraminic acid mutarotase